MNEIKCKAKKDAFIYGTNEQWLTKNKIYTLVEDDMDFYEFNSDCQSNHLLQKHKFDLYFEQINNVEKIDYWKNITEIQEKQTAKGIKKYGDVLENNPTNLDVFERLQYIQEELIDALMYIEHLKIKLEEK